MLISNKYLFLAARLDRFLEEDGIIEIKCSYSARNVTPEQAIENKLIKFAILDDKNNLKVKENDDCSYQIQGQLNITDRKYCIFVI